MIIINFYYCVRRFTQQAEFNDDVNNNNQRTYYCKSDSKCHEYALHASMSWTGAIFRIINGEKATEIRFVEIVLKAIAHQIINVIFVIVSSTVRMIFECILKFIDLAMLHVLFAGMKDSVLEQTLPVTLSLAIAVDASVKKMLEEPFTSL